MSALYVDFFGGGTLAAPKVYAPGDAPNNKNPGGVSDNELARQKRAAIKKEQDKVIAAQVAARNPYNKSNTGINLVGSLASVVTAPVKVVAKAGRTVSKELGKVPVVGGGVKGLFDLTVNAPLQLAGKVASGQRLDKVALATLKEKIQAVRAVAPYAQTVIALVPGIGPGVSAAVGAGLALAAGQSITSALVAGLRSALPGGALAQQVFDAGRAVVEGKSLSSIALSALPLDANAKKGLSIALDVTSRIARGQKVDDALLAQADKAMALLPESARKALQIGTAVAEGKRLQDIAAGQLTAANLKSAAAAAGVKAGAPVNLIPKSVTNAANKAKAAVSSVKASVSKISVPKLAVPKAIVKVAAKTALPKVVLPKAPTAAVIRSSAVLRIAAPVKAVVKAVASSSAASAASAKAAAAKAAADKAAKNLASLKAQAKVKAELAAKNAAAKAKAKAPAAKAVVKPAVKAPAPKAAPPKAAAKAPAVSVGSMATMGYLPISKTPPKTPAKVAPANAALSAAAKAIAKPLTNATPPKTIATPPKAVQAKIAPPAAAMAPVNTKPVVEGWFIPTTGPNKNRIDRTTKRWQAAAA